MEMLKDAQNTMHQAHSATYSSLGITHHRPVQRPPLRAAFLKLVVIMFIWDVWGRRTRQERGFVADWLYA